MESFILNSGISLVLKGIEHYNSLCHIKFGSSISGYNLKNTKPIHTFYNHCEAFRKADING